MQKMQKMQEMQDWQKIDWDAPKAVKSVKVSSEEDEWQKAQAYDPSAFADEDVGMFQEKATPRAKPKTQKTQKIESDEERRKRQIKQKDETKQKEQRLQNVCIADRSRANGGLNLDEMLVSAAGLDVGTGTRAEVRLALCKKYYPDIKVTPTTLGGSENIKVPGQKQKVKQYKNIMPSDEEIKQRMKRFCAFDSSYSTGGWNSDQMQEIAAWFGINTRTADGKVVSRKILRELICNTFNAYTKKIFIPTLYEETPTSKITQKYDLEKLRPLMDQFTKKLVNQLELVLPTKRAEPGMVSFYSFSKAVTKANIEYRYEGYPIIMMMQGPLDDDGNPAPRILPDQMTVIDKLYKAINSVYVNELDDKVSLTQKPGFAPKPVDFAILEERGHVNVYAIWNIPRWAKKAKFVVSKQTTKEYKAPRNPKQGSQGKQGKQGSQGKDELNIFGHDFPKLM